MICRPYGFVIPAVLSVCAFVACEVPMQWLVNFNRGLIPFWQDAAGGATRLRGGRRLRDLTVDGY